MKVYLITGASSDIGLSYIQSLENKKESCIVLGQCYTGVENLETCKKVLEYVSLYIYRCDFSNEEEVIKWLDQIESDGYEPTHILHLAASKFGYVRFRDFDWYRTRRDLQIQVNSFIQLAKRMLPRMARKRNGKILVMLTCCTLGVPPKFMSEYIMVKYALLGIMKAIASEYGGKGITINGISPNMIETKFLSNLDSRLIEINGENSSMKRNLTVEEVVQAMDFFMMDKSNYINGVNFNITGGDYM